MSVAGVVPPPLPDVHRGSGGRWSALWTLYRLTLRQHQHGKRWIVMASLMLVPAGLAVLARATANRVPFVSIEFRFVFMFIPQALLPLAALIYASGMIQDEQEDQTLTYLLIRPISKWALYLVKLAGTLSVAVLLTVIFTALTYVAIYFRSEVEGMDVLHRCAVACAVHSLAVVAYCCLFGLMGLMTKRTLIVGILYIAIFEGLFANLPFGIRLITVIYYARLIVYRLLPFVVPEPYGMRDLAADGWQLEAASDPALLEHPTMRTCLIVLGVASGVLALAGALICSSREFHVKTPEKA